MAHEHHEAGCVFCGIVAGELPAARIAEDEAMITIADAFPASPGHALVIAKGHYADLFTLPASLLGPVYRAVQRVAAAQRSALAPDGIAVTQFNGRAAGQTVFHYHVHVVPRWAGQPWQSHGNTPAEPEDLESMAASLRAALD
ncbi:MAG TPA: HIT family protein [Gammaproteobacteria bacterium]|nr:HIT family protein [Gammaproteobacteria bacterium]